MTRLLADTQVALWHALGDPRLGPRPTAAIEAVDAEVFISVASFWEIAIKLGLGKLEAPEDLPAQLGELGFRPLAIAVEHAWALRSLPLHHRDPFDRLLVAQARVERLSIVTSDPVFAAYGVPVVWD